MTIWRLFWIVFLGTLIGIGALGPWFRQSREDAARERQREAAEMEAHRAHVRWLNSLPESEKKRWPIGNVCRPSAWDDCRCLGSWVVYTEILPNGDVACHETH